MTKTEEAIWIAAYTAALNTGGTVMHATERADASIADLPLAATYSERASSLFDRVLSERYDAQQRSIS